VVNYRDVVESSLGVVGAGASAHFYVRGIESLLGFGTITPPGSPAVGDRYVPGVGATGAWSGTVGQVVRWNGTSWDAQAPAKGSAVFDSVGLEVYFFTGTAWLSHEGLKRAAVGTTVDIYVSGSLGVDTNPGTQALPVATLARAEEMIPDVVQARTRIHLRNETYALPSTRDRWMRSRTLHARIEVLADAAWDSTVYTIQASGASAAGTNSTTVVTSGLTTNAQRGRSIRMTSGAASGQYRRINSNTTTDIKVNAAFSPAPTTGDTFEVFTTTAIITAPAPLSASTARYVVVDSMLGGSGTSPNIPGSTGASMGEPNGVHFYGVTITSTGVSCVFGAGATYFFGVELPKLVRKIGGQIWSGQAAALPLLEGWGVRITGTTGVQLSLAGQLNGYIHADTGFPGIDYGCSASIIGGFGGRSFNTIIGYCNIVAPSATPFLWEATTPPVQLSRASGFLELQNVVVTNTGAGGGFVLSNGATVLLFSTVTGTGAIGMTITGNSRVVCSGAPAYGDAVANDWTVNGMAAFNKSALAAVGSGVLSTVDGSVASRAL
jgi:hypothetical protein